MIGRALIHPLQQQILERFDELDGVTSSPVELAQFLHEPLGNVSYHVKVLTGDTGDNRTKGRFADCPLLEFSHTEPRRGAIEHFYQLTKVATRKEKVVA